MKAGRELDALVAERVMGWKRRIGPRSGKFITLYPPHVDIEDWKLSRKWKPWPFSTNPAYALEVVESLSDNNHGEVFSLVLVQPIGEPIEYRATFRDVYAYAPTAPLAICIAALRAVGAL